MFSHFLKEQNSIGSCIGWKYLHHLITGKAINYKYIDKYRRLFYMCPFGFSRLALV